MKRVRSHRIPALALGVLLILPLGLVTGPVGAAAPAPVENTCYATNPHKVLMADGTWAPVHRLPALNYFFDFYPEVGYVPTPHGADWSKMGGIVCDGHIYVFAQTWSNVFVGLGMHPVLTATTDSVSYAVNHSLWTYTVNDNTFTSQALSPRPGVSATAPPQVHDLGYPGALLVQWHSDGQKHILVPAMAAMAVAPDVLVAPWKPGPGRLLVCIGVPPRTGACDA